MTETYSINEECECLDQGRVFFSDSVDLIWQMTGLSSLCTLVSERYSRFLSKFHQSSPFWPLISLFYCRMF